jgi:hypothetical protein
MKRFCVSVFILMFLLCLPSSLRAAEPQHKQVDETVYERIQAVIQAYLKEKTLSSGTLDIYDDAVNAVRHLRAVESKKEVKRDGENYVSLLDYRDVSSGALVTVAFMVKEAAAGGLVVENLKIEKVADLTKPQEEIDENKKYSDAQVQEFMRNYVEKQSKFTDYIFLFDEERDTMRKLKLIKLKDEVRRMGIMSVSTGEFQDTISGDTVIIDISVVNKKGQLRIQNLLIRKVYKSPPPA